MPFVRAQSKQEADESVVVSEDKLCFFRTQVTRAVDELTLANLPRTIIPGEWQQCDLKEPECYTALTTITLNVSKPHGSYHVFDECQLGGPQSKAAVVANKPMLLLASKLTLAPPGKNGWRARVGVRWRRPDFQREEHRVSSFPSFAFVVEVISRVHSRGQRHNVNTASGSSPPTWRPCTRTA